MVRVHETGKKRPQKNEMGRLSLQRVYKKACGGRMAQCLMTFGVIGSIEPSSLTTPGGIMHPGLPPHTPYLGTPVVFPPGQRPVSFFLRHYKNSKAHDENPAVSRKFG